MKKREIIGLKPLRNFLVRLYRQAFPQRLGVKHPFASRIILQPMLCFEFPITPEPDTMDVGHPVDRRDNMLRCPARDVIGAIHQDHISQTLQNEDIYFPLIVAIHAVDLRHITPKPVVLLRIHHQFTHMATAEIKLTINLFEGCRQLGTTERREPADHPDHLAVSWLAFDHDIDIPRFPRSRGERKAVGKVPHQFAHTIRRELGENAGAKFNMGQRYGIRDLGAGIRCVSHHRVKKSWV